MSNLQKRPKSQMSDRERIRDFQRKIYLKAKQEQDFRFYILYDKVRMLRFLREAYKRVKANKGIPGVDKVTFEMIEEQGIENYLQEIQTELKERTYRPSPILRVYIPKDNGKERPLGIPTIKDRIVQMSCKMVIEPIFEADFEDSSYGFRPKRSAQDAIKQIKENLREGKINVLDADLSKFFDTIPHDKLMIVVCQRISDENVIHLIKMWLKAPILDKREGGSAKKNKIGTPQGGVISPLLANIYLNLVDRLVNKLNSIFYKERIKIVRYADDFVLLGKRISKNVIDKLKSILERMGLKLNEDKTKIVNVLKEGFDFLGFTIRYDKDLFGRDRKYLNIIPSKKSLNKIRAKINNYLKDNGLSNPIELVKGLNRIIRGWINYYRIPKVSYPRKVFRELRYYIMNRINRYYYRKSQRKSKLYCHRAFDVMNNKYGLIDPSKC